MKKLTSYILTLALCLYMTGCAKAADVQKEDKAGVTAAAAAAPEETAAAETTPDAETVITLSDDGITVEGGWMWNGIAHKPFKVKGKGSSTPLIDTGSLRSSITHVIEGK